MGHERVGLLPRRQRWIEIVEDISNSDLSSDEIADIARRTLRNVRRRYLRVGHDKSVHAAFQYLLYLAVSSKMEDPRKYLDSLGISISKDPSLLSFAGTAHDWVKASLGNPEYAEIARSAVGDTIALWHEKHKIRQQSLFDSRTDPYETWRAASNGSGFCELARIYFSKLTERYLNYFLEREASAAATNLDQRERLRGAIREHVDSISQHAFETSKITQSFAAGWYNRHTQEGIPSKRDIDSFIAYAFEKMSEELLREEYSL